MTANTHGTTLGVYLRPDTCGVRDWIQLRVVMSATPACLRIGVRYCYISWTLVTPGGAADTWESDTRRFVPLSTREAVCVALL